MKKLLLLLTFMMVAVVASYSQTQKVGVIGGYYNTNLTYSIDNLEFQLGSNYYATSIYLSADYKLVTDNFPLGDVNGFFWNVGAGAYAQFSSAINLGVIAPFEFGWTVPEILEERLEIYLQYTPSLNILTNFAPSIYADWTNGAFGVRFKL